jgi:hypothetical protein
VVNVNLLTTLGYQREQVLVKGGDSLDDARKTAEKEVLAAFHIRNAEQYPNFGQLDLGKSGPANVILAALSSVVDYGLSAGNLASLIANFQADIADNGVIDTPSILATIAASSAALDPSAVATNLNAKYSSVSLNLTPADIKSWLDRDGDGVVEKFKYYQLNATAGTTYTSQPYIAGPDDDGTTFTVSAGTLFNNGTAVASGGGVVHTGDSLTIQLTASPNPNVSTAAYMLSDGLRVARFTITMVNPATVSIAAAPASIAGGASSTLSVTAANASSVTVTGSDGSSYQLSSIGGTQAVSPAKTTTYTAVATGVSGPVSATATVTVTGSTNPPPTVSISATPSAISPRSSSNLLVSATNATQVSVTGSDGSSYTLPSTGGTQAVSPTATTTYIATATGAGGSATATATITVTANPRPTVTISANPTAIAPGSSSVLTITATLATQVTVTGSDGSSYTLAASGGTQAVSPAATTVYTATATGAGWTASGTVTVTVSANPAPTVQITASPGSIMSGIHRL